jgi:hypothetical protein
MVAHDQQVAGRHEPQRLVADLRIRPLGHAVVLVDVRLVELDAVDVDEAIAQLDPVAWQPDDPLDERHATARGDGLRWIEHDDVAARERRPVR